jgi:Ser/Thr protein kinase RdoA (MazF antagonist)
MWRYLPPGEPLTASHLGVVLREFHALGLPPFPLPAWNPVADARRRLADAEALTDEERQTLQQWCDGLEPQLAALLQGQDSALVHGDAHVGNLLRDGDRVVFCDFDATCAGPWQADLAALAVAEQRFGRAGLHGELAASYGYDVLEDPAWPLLQSARELKMIAAAVPLLSSAPGVREEFRLRLQTIVSDDHVTRWTPFSEL